MPVAVQAETLPTLDLRRFDAGGAERPRFLNKLLMAARNVGFFYLVGHGIENSLIRDVLSVSRRFFALPEKDKLAIEMVNSPHFRGYNRAGYEYTRGKRTGASRSTSGRKGRRCPSIPAAPPWKRLQGPNQWPSALPGVQAGSARLPGARRPRSRSGCCEAFAAALEQPEDVFAPIYSPAPNQLIKIIRYPGRLAGESDQGVGAHKDSGFVAVLLQDQVAGLQVEGEDGWIDAPPVPGSFVINVGEILRNGVERLSARQRPSRRLAAAGEDRLSVAFFLGARLDCDSAAARRCRRTWPPRRAASRRTLTIRSFAKSAAII